MSAKPEILLRAKRGSLAEREHAGFVLVVDSNENIIAKVGETNEDYLLRSCAKPFQALPVITSGAFEKFGLNLKHLAVCCGSHAGSAKHVKLVSEILQKIGLCEDNLKCGIHAPLDKRTRLDLIRNNLEPTSIHNNCSGKHAGMLAVCVAKGWDIESYLDFEHPLQKEILRLTCRYSNIENPPMSVDGCGTPICAMSLAKMGAGFIKLFSSNEGNKLKEAFLSYPYLIGGNGRQDTAIISASADTLIAKVGAEGLCVVVNPDKAQALVVKIHDGSMKARAIVLFEALKQLGWLSEQQMNTPFAKEFYDIEVKTHSGEVVGGIEITESLFNKIFTPEVF